MIANTLKAVVWDVDGMIAGVELDGHRVAFNRAFLACGLNWHWSEARYGELLPIVASRERLLRDMVERPDAPRRADQRVALARRIDEAKDAIYPDLLRHVHLPLRDGVLSLMQECRLRRIRLAIATTTSRVCVEALLRLPLGADWSDWFDTLVCGEQVRRRKPHPELYVRALLEARVCPCDAVAIEGSLLGVAAARVLDMPVVLTLGGPGTAVAVRGAVATGPGLHQRAGWYPGVADAAGGLDGREGGCIVLADIDRWLALARDRRI